MRCSPSQPRKTFHHAPLVSERSPHYVLWSFQVARLQMAANILASGDLYWPLRAVATEVQDWFNRFKEVPYGPLN